ncbi:cytochrome c oxidase assembly protein COX20, mitochondrial-like [Panonychus citri]|uniref:cytochrome c oxidase assembly protein COX20, mitochondrial-like n=1 Tax=Panonychus citri TaxID=50023 RepID=UPI002307626B|nr:cytochrome c oxidase assembly protein COX20, mitochondrial-like [Panonychus citri]
MSDEIDDDLEEKVGFWKRFAGQPCVRQTYLYSFTGGLIVGSLNFMFTSNVNLSQIRGISTFAGTMGIYWVFCRYNYFKEQKELKKISETIAERALTLGVNPNDPIIPEEFKR